MSDPRLSSILARHDLTPSQRVDNLIDCARREGSTPEARRDAEDAFNAAREDMIGRLAAHPPAAAPASVVAAWESMPNGLHETWWTLDVYKSGDRELYAIVKERDDRSTATWAVSAQGDGDDHAAIAEGVAESVDAAQLAAESVLRTVARGINGAIAAVPGEVVAAAREVLALKIDPRGYIASGGDYAPTGAGLFIDNGPVDVIHGGDGEGPDQVADGDSDTMTACAKCLSAAPLLAAWVTAQAEGRGE